MLAPKLAPFFAPRVAQEQYVLIVRLLPGPGPVQDNEKTTGLTKEELELLTAAGLTGTLEHGIEQTVGTGPPHARVVVVVRGCIAEPAELRLPDAANVVYVQEKEGWKLLPPDAPTLRATLRLPAQEEDSGSISYQLPALGASGSFGWNDLSCGQPE